MTCPCSGCTKKITCSSCGATLCERCKQSIDVNAPHMDCGIGLRHLCVVEDELRIKSSNPLEAVAELLSGSAHNAAPANKRRSYKEDTSFDLYTHLTSEVLSLLA